MDFFINSLGLIASLSFLIWGADKFVDYSSIIAKKLGVNELTIGLTVVALGTSAPEIFVGISSVINNSESIALGAVVGSNISNIGLIFGVSCIGIFLKPKETPLIQFVPFILSVIILGYSLYDLKISKLDSFLLVLVFCYFLYVIVKNRFDENTYLDTSPSDQQNYIVVFFILIGLLSLILGSRYAVIFAEKIAFMLNISELVIGLTIIAIGTSLPELAATVSAVIRRKTDMVVGNVIGSNVLNITLVVPIIGIFSNVSLESVLFSRDYLLMAFASIAFITLALIYSKEQISIFGIKFIGFLFVTSYFMYLLFLANII
tara:strand:- start:8956 stop:9909 length:954 start_codon:yes stop_codon:yes gene_type:complete